MAQKKSFKSDITNPAMQFISMSTEDINSAKELKNTPNGYKLNPLYVETKSKRVQLLLQPTLFEKLKNKAKNENRSVNDLIHSILDNALK